MLYRVIGYRGFPQGSPHPFFAHFRRKQLVRRVPSTHGAGQYISSYGVVCVCVCVFLPFMTTPIIILWLLLPVRACATLWLYARVSECIHTALLPSDVMALAGPFAKSFFRLLPLLAAAAAAAYLPHFHHLCVLQGCTLAPLLTLIVPLCLSLSSDGRIAGSRRRGGAGRPGGNVWRYVAAGAMAVATGVVGVAGLVASWELLRSDRQWGLAHLKVGGRVFRARW